MIETTDDPRAPGRILVLGGGFAGVSVASELVKRLRRSGRLIAPRSEGRRRIGRSIGRLGRSREAPHGVFPRAYEVWLVDRDNYSVFQPFLPEILSATIEPTHAVVPLRRLLPHVQVEVGVVERIVADERRVMLRRPLDGAPFEVTYDALVIALGGVTDFSVVPGMVEHALGFRTLGDAFYLRNRALEMLEAARVEADPERRARQLTFAIVGGGSTGVEVAAQLQDLVQAAGRTFRRPDLRPRVVLVHGRDIVLGEYGERLGRYTTRLLARQGIELVLGRRVVSVDEHGLELDGGGRIESETIVSTVGNAPNPSLRDLPTRYDRRGWLQPDDTFALPDLPGVWTLGDAASIPDATTGQPMPATAQHAIREGPHLARNLLAALDGERPTPFHYGALGMLVSLGRRKGAGTILGIKVSGFVAWFAWRSYYLLRMPTLDRRVRVALDWTADLVLPRDVVEISVRRTRVGPGDPAEVRGEPTSLGAREPGDPQLTV